MRATKSYRSSEQYPKNNVLKVLGILKPFFQEGFKPPKARLPLMDPFEDLYPPRALQARGTPPLRSQEPPHRPRDAPANEQDRGC